MEIFKKLTMLENEDENFGFKWENAKQIVTQIRSELLEIEAHLEKLADKNQLQEEVGDLLHAAFSLCVFLKFDPNETVKNSVDKFERRFKATKQLANDSGLKDLNGQTFDTLMAFWDKAKEHVG